MPHVSRCPATCQLAPFSTARSCFRVAQVPDLTGLKRCRRAASAVPVKEQSSVQSLVPSQLGLGCTFLSFVSCYASLPQKQEMFVFSPSYLLCLFVCALALGHCNSRNKGLRNPALVFPGCDDIQNTVILRDQRPRQLLQIAAGGPYDAEPL